MEEFSCYWNSHYIRQSRHDSVAGIPDVLFYLPEESGYVNQKHDVTNAEIENILRERDVVAEGELEIINVMLIWKNFSIMLFKMKVYLTLHEAGEKGKEILNKS